MDYYVKKAVEVVKKRRRSREEVEEEVSVEQSESVGPGKTVSSLIEPWADLHLAAKNCVINVDPSRKDSITSEDLERYNPSFGYAGFDVI